jgi:hypothetical protein
MISNYNIFLVYKNQKLFKLILGSSHSGLVFLVDLSESHVIFVPMGTHLSLTFTLVLNDRKQIQLLIHAIADHSPEHPVYIVQLEDSMQVTFDSAWGMTEIEREFAAHFPDYEYTEDISDGQEEILLSITRMQHPTSSNSWGQTWNEDTMVSYKYLVKKREREPAKPPHPIFWVLFGNELKEYWVHVVPGYTEGTDRKGFLVIKPSALEGGESTILSKLLPDETSAFWEGQRLMERDIEVEYEAYQKQLAKERRKRKKS